jgi:hypothetical protein
LVVDAFLARSATRCGNVQDLLAKLFDDALTTGVMRASVLFEDGVAVGLVRRDPQLVPQYFVHRPAFSFIRTEHTMAVWAGPPPVLAPDADNWKLYRVVLSLQRAGSMLLSTLLNEVVHSQGVFHALVRVRFADPLEPAELQTVVETPGVLTTASEAAVQTFPGGVRLRVPAGMTRQDVIAECLDAAELAKRYSGRTIAGMWLKRHHRTLTNKTADKMVTVGRAILAEKAEDEDAVRK